MIDSCIPGLTKSAILYVYKNLMIDSSDDEAREAFTKLVYSQLLLQIFKFENNKNCLE
jgi:hypothetical protein